MLKDVPKLENAEVQPLFEILLGSKIRPSSRFTWPLLVNDCDGILRGYCHLNERWNQGQVVRVRHCRIVPPYMIAVVQRYRLSELWMVGEPEHQQLYGQMETLLRARFSGAPISEVGFFRSQVPEECDDSRSGRKRRKKR